MLLDDKMTHVSYEIIMIISYDNHYCFITNIIIIIIIATTITIIIIAIIAAS